MVLDALRAATSKRKWIAVLVATLIMAVSTWTMLYAFVAAAVDEGPDPGPPFALGVALVPFAFMALAFLSGNPRPGVVVVAMLLSVAVALPVSAVAQDVVTGVAAGYGAGGAVALRPVYYHSRWPRVIAVVMMALYIFIVLRLSPIAGLIAGSVLPFVVLALADLVADWRLADRRPESSEEADG